MVYLRSGVGDQGEIGCNVYSMNTMETLIEEIGGQAHWSDFHMPFSIPKTDDVMRGWTEDDFRGRNYVIYGSNQFASQKLLKIKLA